MLVRKTSLSAVVPYSVAIGINYTYYIPRYAELIGGLVFAGTYEF